MLERSDDLRNAININSLSFVLKNDEMEVKRVEDRGRLQELKEGSVTGFFSKSIFLAEVGSPCTYSLDPRFEKAFSRLSNLLYTFFFPPFPPSCPSSSPPWIFNWITLTSFHSFFFFFFFLFIYATPFSTYVCTFLFNGFLILTIFSSSPA